MARHQRVLLLVDYSNLLYKAYFGSIRGMTVRPWLPIVRYLEMLRLCGRRIHSRYAGDTTLEVIFAGESKTTLDRTKLNPQYKAHRSSAQDPEFQSFRVIFEKVLQDGGWDILTKDGQEADDVIASIVASVDKVHSCDCIKQCGPDCSCQLKQGRPKIVIFSADKDLLQLLKYPDVEIYRSPDTFINDVIFRQEYGFDPKEYTRYKALVGDKSDGISGVFGWGPAKAKEHIVKGDVMSLLAEEGHMDVYNEALNLIQLNYGLVVPTRGAPLTLIRPVVSESDILSKYGIEAYNEILNTMRRTEIEMTPQIYIPFADMVEIYS